MLQTVDQGQAKAEFILFFFGGSGALGIGGAQVPKILKEYDGIRALGGGSTLGGDDLDCNPLATLGYPEPLKIKDIQQIIKECPPVDQILAKGLKKTYMAQLGYVEKGAFDEVLKNCNPLARYAIFEALSGGGGANVVSPTQLTSKIDAWRNGDGLDLFKGELLNANLKKFSAFGVFAFLIALVLDLVIESGFNAFVE